LAHGGRSSSPLGMRSSDHGAAEEAVIKVRWPLLESYALARQEGLAEPTGLVIDVSELYGRRLAEALFADARLPAHGSQRVSCVERALLVSQLRGPAPEVAEALRSYEDEPGHFTAVVLAERGSVVTGTWQELIAASSKRAGIRSQR
jgi:hypothetical protein